jgi:hypothetical protein
MQTCTDCGLKKPLTEFALYPGAKAGWHGRCRVCKRKLERERYRSDPNKLEKHRLHRRLYMRLYARRLRERRRLARLQQIEPTELVSQ